TYPVARMAAHEGAQFMRLFGHISREDIPMTAPVLMEGIVPDEEQRAVPLMAFYYPSVGTGEAGADPADGSVEVVDTEPMTVVSYAFFGSRNAGPTVVEARAAIDMLIDERGLTSVGAPRLMGYNGPGVPRARQLVEVQQEVEMPSADDDAAEPGGAAEATSPAQGEE
ncbi:MAG: heme-binding protein, partial [Planctomycetota bacterium]